MDGLLGDVVTLGVCKTVCSLLLLPVLMPSFGSVGLCCSCLLLFTDLAVTGFLGLLSLSDRQPSDDAIALRFLIFLGHTYSTVLLLTTPLIVVETASRLQWPNPRLSYAPGFLCSLLVWIQCGLCGSANASANSGVEACLLSDKSLTTCLPNLLTVTALAAKDLSLLLLLLPSLTLSLGLLSRGQSVKVFAITSDTPHLGLPHPHAGLNGRGLILSGLLCGLALYFLPLAISVNMLLLRSVESVARWGLSHLLPAKLYHESWDMGVEPLSYC